MRNVWDADCREHQIQILCSVTFYQKSCHLWDNVEKYARAGHATDDNIIGRKCFTCWMTKTTDTHTHTLLTTLKFYHMEWNKHSLFCDTYKFTPRSERRIFWFCTWWCMKYPQHFKGISCKENVKFCTTLYSTLSLSQFYNEILCYGKKNSLVVYSAILTVFFKICVTF